ncbi:MAG: hypothetical protein ACOCZ5_00080 [bacterium]
MSKHLVKRWEKMAGPMSIKNIEDKYIKENLAVLLENQEKKDFSGRDVFLNESQGSTNTGALDSYADASQTATDWRFRPIALALVRRTFPDLFANKCVGVQAMSTPVGLAYAMRVVYDNDPTVEAAFADVDKYGGYTGNPGTSADPVGGGTNTSASTGILDTSGTGVATGIGEDFQIGGTSPGTDKYNELGIRIDQVAITAATRKLAASFSLEAAQDIKAMHGVDVEREMVNFLQYEITAELDRELIYNMKRVATDTSKGGRIISAIDCTVDQIGAGAQMKGRWEAEQYMNVVATIMNQVNEIAISTRRGPGNFVIVSPRIATALQAAGHQFVQYESKVNPGTTMAAIGKLNGTVDVYRDTYASTDYALVGYKGPGISDAGLIFSPYIMGLTNRAIHPDDFTPRIGTMSRYAITDSLLGAGRYYRLIPFYNVDTIIHGGGNGKLFNSAP